jgi:hypothetical protein
MFVAPIGEDTQTFYNFKNLNVSSANILVLTGLQHQYIGAVQGESKCLQHHAAKLKTKRTSITTMGVKIQAFDIFQTPLSSHYPLPLINVFMLGSYFVWK